MKNLSYKNDKFDRTNPLSIFNYSRHLIGNSLHSLLGNKAIKQKRKGKGKFTLTKIIGNEIYFFIAVR